MTSPRKFAEKIALLQQKQAQDDAAFNSILNEVEAAKQKAEHGHLSRTNNDVLNRKHEKCFRHETNGTKNFERNNHMLNVEHPDGSDSLLRLPENSSTWRRTHSDSSLHSSMMPQVVANYHARLEQENPNLAFERFQFDQPLNYDENQQVKFDFHSYQMTPTTTTTPPQYPMATNHFQPSPHYQYDLNNNNNYANGQMNSHYSFTSAPTTPLPQTMATTANPAVVSNQHHPTHTPLGGRSSFGNQTPNVLMLPPNQHVRANGGSLPDLRTGNPYQPSAPMSFSTVSSPPTTQNQRFFRSTSPQTNGSDIDLFSLGPQQQLPSSIGPLKNSPSMRRRHSPIGEVRQASPRRQNSPSPEPSALASQLAGVAASSSTSTNYRGEPSSPQSQSSYSPQNSPHLISSPVGNEHNSYSPPSLNENQQTQPYNTLPIHFDRINLDANRIYPGQGNVSSMPSTQDHSTFNDSFSSFFDDLSMQFSQPTMMTNPNTQKSPTIPNIILTGVDSSKLDLSNELDNLIDPLGLTLDTDDFDTNNDDLWKC